MRDASTHTSLTSIFIDPAMHLRSLRGPVRIDVAQNFCESSVSSQPPFPGCVVHQMQPRNNNSKNSYEFHESSTFLVFDED